MKIFAEALDETNCEHWERVPPNMLLAAFPRNTDDNSYIARAEKVYEKLLMPLDKNGAVIAMKFGVATYLQENLNTPYTPDGDIVSIAMKDACKIWKEKYPEG
jgi:hypothetical protein